MTHISATTNPKKARREDPESPRQEFHLQHVAPGSEFWKSYVNTCVDYIAEEWPDVLNGTSRENFLENYEVDLARRLGEGGRYLVFCVNQGQRVGIANLYTHCLYSKKGEPIKTRLTLHVAEFQVAHRFRRQGIGRQFLNLIYNFGRSLGCRSLSVEVDFNKEKANAFWSAAMGVATQANGRNLFSVDLTS